MAVGFTSHTTCAAHEKLESTGEESGEVKNVFKPQDQKDIK